MKAIYLFIMIFSLSFYSCNEDLINDKTEDCSKYDLSKIENGWSVKLDDYYNYKKLKWVDMGDDLITIIYSNNNNVIQLFDKENGELKSSFLINKDSGSGNITHRTKFYTYKNRFVFAYFDDIYVCNPYTKETTKLVNNADVSGEISVSGNKIVYASYQYENKHDNIIMLDVESLKIDTIVQKIRNSDENIDFEDPYLYISSNNDSLMYYQENEPGNSSVLMLYNFKTGKNQKIQNNKIFTEDIIQNNNELYCNSDSYFYKLNPDNLNVEWEVKFDRHSILHNPEIYFVDNNIIIYTIFNAVSINKNTGKINWKESFSYISSGAYYSVDKAILSGDNIYLNYKKTLFRTLNIRTGKFSEFYCHIPKAFNAFSIYSEKDNIYSISLSKEMSKYTLK